MTKQMWMVRSRAGQDYENFKEKSAVALGFPAVGRIQKGETTKIVMARLAADTSDKSFLSDVSQIVRFVNEVNVGDSVVTYSPSLRRYSIGEFISEWKYDAAIVDSELANARRVKWLGEVERDGLSVESKNLLGSALTLFMIGDECSKELLSKINAPASAAPTTSLLVEAEADERLLLNETVDRAIEFTKDRVNRLTWQDMQELVGGLLRAMGYKTRISPSGPDQGKDIVASPDGFGFEHPRIVVEVKHRTSQMGSREIRSFLGGRHKDDRGLYVSTGGFSREARYEAERASIPLTLLDLDDLVKALIENYERLDPESKRLLPLKRLYWPA